MVHTGVATTGGHWYAFIKHPEDSSWYRMDDQKTTHESLTEDQVLNSKPQPTGFIYRRTGNFDTTRSFENVYAFFYWVHAHWSIEKKKCVFLPNVLKLREKIVNLFHLQVWLDCLFHVSRKNQTSVISKKIILFAVSYFCGMYRRCPSQVKQHTDTNTFCW